MTVEVLVGRSNGEPLSMSGAAGRGSRGMGKGPYTLSGGLLELTAIVIKPSNRIRESWTATIIEMNPRPKWSDHRSESKTVVVRLLERINEHRGGTIVSCWPLAISVTGTLGEQEV